MSDTQTTLKPLALDAKTTELFNQYLVAREKQLRGRMQLDPESPNWPARRAEVLVTKKVLDDLLNGKIPDFHLINQEGVK